MCDEQRKPNGGRGMTVQEKASSGNDPRYDFVTCPHCGQMHQVIDFRCAWHALKCPVDAIDYGQLEIHES